MLAAIKTRLTEPVPSWTCCLRMAAPPERAPSAWDWIFAHSSRADREVVEEACAGKTDMSVGAYIVILGAELAKKENGRSAAPYRGRFLPNNMWLWFYVVSTNVPPPCSVCF